MTEDKFTDAYSSLPAQLNGVSVKPTGFWRNSPELWFVHLESQFDLASIVSDKTKFNIVISALDESICRSVSDVIFDTSIIQKYDSLKKILIERFSCSEDTKLKQLLYEINLGDSLPSHLLKEMNDLNHGILNDNVIKSLWLSRLPIEFQNILLCNSGSLKELASYADKLTEINRKPTVMAVTSSNNISQNTVDKLSNCVDALSKLVENQIKQSSYRSSSRNSDSNRKIVLQTSNSINKSSHVCWYHFKFGNNAKKCIKPCSFKMTKLNDYNINSSNSLN